MGKTVILQTVPPFDYKGENIEKWHRINKHIKNVLSAKAALIFDNSSVLSKSDEEKHMLRFGGHPNEEGCALWADSLYEAVKVFFR